MLLLVVALQIGGCWVPRPGVWGAAPPFSLPRPQPCQRLLPRDSPWSPLLVQQKIGARRCDIR
jgi:hypothetical protein